MCSRSGVCGKRARAALLPPCWARRGSRPAVAAVAGTRRPAGTEAPGQRGVPRATAPRAPAATPVLTLPQVELPGARPAVWEVLSQVVRVARAARPSAVLLGLAQRAGPAAPPRVARAARPPLAVWAERASAVSAAARRAPRTGNSAPRLRSAAKRDASTRNAAARSGRAAPPSATAATAAAPRASAARTTNPHALLRATAATVAAPTDGAASRSARRWAPTSSAAQTTPTTATRTRRSPEPARARRSESAPLTRSTAARDKSTLGCAAFRTGRRANTTATAALAGPRPTLV